MLGENLAASAEMLHRLCRVDVCVIGEGEKVIVNLANHFLAHGDFDDGGALRKIRGISFVDSNSEFVFAGYEEAIAGRELLDPDFSILEDSSNIQQFILDDPTKQPSFARDPRTSETHRAGKRMAIVVSTKGCVARCMFYHRWDKGFG